VKREATFSNKPGEQGKSDQRTASEPVEGKPIAIILGVMYERSKLKPSWMKRFFFLETACLSFVFMALKLVLYWQASFTKYCLPVFDL
jgi:hypothetical protein